MKWTFVVGEMALISSTTGASLESVRPVRKIVEGEACARERAVSAPIEFGEGPVMSTEVSEVSALLLVGGGIGEGEKLTCFAFYSL